MAHIKPGKCLHFNGIQNKTCEAGVTYQPHPSPCFSEAGAWACDKYREPTREEIDADEVDFKAAMDRMRVVMTAIAPWRKEKPRGKQTVIDCPTGCGGKLHLSQSSYNGHVHGQCTTKGCVSWME